jgi:hypothetical protein
MGEEPLGRRSLLGSSGGGDDPCKQGQVVAFRSGKHGLREEGRSEFTSCASNWRMKDSTWKPKIWQSTSIFATMHTCALSPDCAFFQKSGNVRFMFAELNLYWVSFVRIYTTTTLHSPSLPPSEPPQHNHRFFFPARPSSRVLFFLGAPFPLTFAKSIVSSRSNSSSLKPFMFG